MISFLGSLFSLLTVTRNVSYSYCDIKGSVKNPGVYEVKKGEVINDIIKKAGGLSKNAYVRNINLSKKVKDEMVIYILSKDEYEDLTYVCPVCDCEEKIKQFCEEKSQEEITTKVPKENILEEELPKTPTTSAVVAEEIHLININTASLEELKKLNGIGDVVANNIIEYRKEHSFEKIEDLLNVKGIGEKLFEKIKDYITI